MVMLDADGLKMVNDIFGHYMGDDYLKRIAAAAGEQTGHGKLSARLGGDEFVVFLYGYSSRDDLAEDIQKMKRHRGEIFIGGEEQVTVTVEFSLGCVFYPEEGTDYHALMHLAVKKMYEEKRKRKNRGKE